MKRRWLIAIGAMVVLAGIAFVAAFLFTRDTVTVENFEKIAAGMNEDAVEAILGKPSGSRDGWRMTTKELGPDDIWREEILDTYARIWHGSAITITVYFDMNGAVMNAEKEDRLTTIERIQRWLGMEEAAPTSLMPYRIHGGVGPVSTSK
jgi:hypothetical protein